MVECVDRSAVAFNLRMTPTHLAGQVFMAHLRCALRAWFPSEHEGLRGVITVPSAAAFTTVL